MAKILILAEKGKEARKYALAFQEHKLVNGVWEVSDPEFGKAHIVGASGHLTELDEPEAYNEKWKKWQLDELPMVPSKFHEHLTDQQSRKLFNTIKKEVMAADQVYIGTDTDREGENIAYSILDLIPNGTAKVKKRLWQNSLTKKGVRQAMNNLREPSETKSLAREAKARQKSDWIAGLNITRLVTLKLREAGYRTEKGDSFQVGRVQTAIVSLLVENDQKIKNFEKTNFWQLELTDQHGIKYKNEKKFKTEVEGQQAFQALKENSVVSEYKVEDKIQTPPKLLNLFDASAVAKKTWGYPSDKTLEIIQSMYEREWVSYPRTEINYISKFEFEYLVKLVAEYQNSLDLHFDITHTEAREKYVDGKKTKEHTALIPTETLPEFKELSDEQKNIYRMITTRTILMFAPDEKQQNVNITLKNQGYEFKASLKKVLDPGYTAYLSQQSKKEQEAPGYSEGQQIFTEAKLVKGETKPPTRLTESKLVQTVLPKYQIGTSATIGKILKDLKKHKYIKDTKEGFYPTDKAKAVVEFLYGTPLVDPDTTSVWEKSLKLIGKNSPRMTEDKFVEITIKLVQGLVQKYRDKTDITVSTLEKDTNPHTRTVLSTMGTCPVCKKGKIEEVRGQGKNGEYHMYACDNSKCHFSIPDHWGGKSIEANEVEQIILNGKTDSFTANSRNNKKFTGYLTIKNKKIAMGFLNPKK